MTEDTFWMVWNQGGNPPRAQHDDRMSAEREAERLARLNPGQRFVVLQSVTARVVNDIQRIDYEPPIPF